MSATPRRSLRSAVTALAMVMFGGSLAQAQQVEAAPAEALACLQPPFEQRTAIDYPFDAWKSDVEGRVAVELRFDTPDAAPAVKILESSAHDVRGEEASDALDAFKSAVVKSVRTWRVPCLKPGQPATVRQDFAFRTDRRKVYSSVPQDGDPALHKRLQACLQHVSGNAAPAYPDDARRARVGGRVVLSLRFAGAADEPRVEVYSGPMKRWLTGTVQSWGEGYRVPCRAPGEEFNADITFIFRIEGEPLEGFEPMDLRALLPLVKGIRTQTLDFDTREMGCPFDVRFRYLRPGLPNNVGSVGSDHPARGALLQWLSNVELDLGVRQLSAVYGDSTTITVPCLNIHLDPKETS